MRRFCRPKHLKAGENSDIQIPLLAWDRMSLFKGTSRFLNQSVAVVCTQHVGQTQTPVQLLCSTEASPHLGAQNNLEKSQKCK